jgi:hypothetical protein
MTHGPDRKNVRPVLGSNVNPTRKGRKGLNVSDLGAARCWKACELLALAVCHGLLTKCYFRANQESTVLQKKHASVFRGTL